MLPVSWIGIHLETFSKCFSNAYTGNSFKYNILDCRSLLIFVRTKRERALEFHYYIFVFLSIPDKQKMSLLLILFCFVKSRSVCEGGRNIWKDRSDLVFCSWGGSYRNGRQWVKIFWNSCNVFSHISLYLEQVHSYFLMNEKNTFFWC